ncbi:helix-turn-helix domain-containing protein [Planctomycetaceae bacterium]|nr:helix-turn-helix domain-containing protein [Planctomycetaceae bacterium]
MLPNVLLRPIAYRPVVAAKLLDISPSHLARLTKAGEIPCALLGGVRVYSDDALREWIIEKTVQNDSLDVRKDTRNDKGLKE